MIRLFRVFIPTSVVALLISEIVLILGCYTGAILLLGIDFQFYLFEENNYWKLLVVTGLIILVLYFQDLYSNLRIPSRILLVQQVCLAVGCALLLMAFVGYLRPDLLLGRWLMIVGSTGVIILLPLWRLAYWRYVVAGLRSERVLLLGNASILSDVIAHLGDRPEFGYSVVGYICEDSPCDFPIPCLGTVSEIRRVCEEYRPTRIVVGMAERRNRLPVQDLLEIRFAGVMIEEAADTYEMVMRRVCSGKIQPSQLIFSAQLGPRPQAIVFQNAYSLVLGIFGMIVTSPLMLLTAIAVKLSLPRIRVLPSAARGLERQSLYPL